MAHLSLLRRVVGNVTIEVGTIVESHIWSDPPRASARARPVYLKRVHMLLHACCMGSSLTFLSLSPHDVSCVFTAKCSQFLLEKKKNRAEKRTRKTLYIS